MNEQAPSLSNNHFVSLNTQGLNNTNKMSRLLVWLKQQKAHIVFLQETHFSPSIKNDTLLQTSEWDVFHSFGTTNSRGCSIFILKHVRY